MAAAKDRARTDGRWLLVLTTEAGGGGEACYRSLGWRILGTMPDHASRNDGGLAATTYFWKNLRT